jgi:hypothetical protein
MMTCEYYFITEEDAGLPIPANIVICLNPPEGDKEVLHFGCGSEECPNYKEK